MSASAAASFFSGGRVGSNDDSRLIRSIRPAGVHPLTRHGIYDGQSSTAYLVATLVLFTHWRHSHAEFTEIGPQSGSNWILGLRLLIIFSFFFRWGRSFGGNETSAAIHESLSSLISNTGSHPPAFSPKGAERGCAHFSSSRSDEGTLGVHKSGLFLRPHV